MRTERSKEKTRWSEDEIPYGKISIQQFLDHELVETYQPRRPDVEFVRAMLRQKGLLAELACEVMEAAGYTVESQLEALDA